MAHFLPDEDEPGERWILLADTDRSPDVRVDIWDAEVECELYGPDGEVISELYEREWGPFGFTAEPWSRWRRY